MRSAGDGQIEREVERAIGIVLGDAGDHGGSRGYGSSRQRPRPGERGSGIALAVTASDDLRQPLSLGPVSGMRSR